MHAVIEETTTPRRRRSGCCPQLRHNGEPATYDTIDRIGLTINVSSTGQSWRNTLFSCAARPADPPGNGYVIDTCASSWHKECPFQPDQQPQVMQLPTMKIVMPDPEPQPETPRMPKAPTPEERARCDELRAAIRAAVPMGQGMNVSRQMGRYDLFFHQAMNAAYPYALELIAKHLGVA